MSLLLHYFFEKSQSASSSLWGYLTEWLRWWTRNPLGNSRVGSNPAVVELVSSLLLFAPTKSSLKPVGTLEVMAFCFLKSIAQWGEINHAIRRKLSYQNNIHSSNLHIRFIYEGFKQIQYYTGTINSLNSFLIRNNQ